jgi:hypothetical protein
VLCNDEIVGTSREKDKTVHLIIGPIEMTGFSSF